MTRNTDRQYIPVGASMLAHSRSERWKLPSPLATKIPVYVVPIFNTNFVQFCQSEAKFYISGVQPGVRKDISGGDILGGNILEVCKIEIYIYI
jgi:hypothetical protein